MPTPQDLAEQFFLQLAVILIVCWLVWALFKRLGQTQVVATMVAGFVLGPSVLGAIAPDVAKELFPATINVGDKTIMHPSLTVLYVVGQLALVFYMFVVGLSFDIKILSKHVRQSATTSLVGVAVPVVLGGIVGWWLASNETFFPSGMKTWQAALFFAAAISVSAFPMLAWIVHSSGLSRTKVGTMALSVAAFDDGVAWILLAAVIASAKQDLSIALIAIGGTIAYVAVTTTVIRHAFRRFADKLADYAALPPFATVATILVLLACAWFTDQVGLYSVFGAFVFGAVMPRGAFADRLRDQIEPITAWVLVPTFFVYSGLNTHLDLILKPEVLGVLVLTVFIAFVGKGGAVGLAARSQGFSWAESTSLGALTNARGLMELVLLNIGLQAGIVTPALYTVLALMTIITTFAASPIHNWIDRRGILRETKPANLPEPEPASVGAANP